MVIAQVGGLAADQATRVSGYWEGVFFSGERVGLNSGFGGSM